MPSVVAVANQRIQRNRIQRNSRRVGSVLDGGSLRHAFSGSSSGSQRQQRLNNQPDACQYVALT